MAAVKRTEDEIDEMVNVAAYYMDVGSKYHGMSYDEGVRAALDWVQGNEEDPPYEPSDVEAMNKAYGGGE